MTCLPAARRDRIEALKDPKNAFVELGVDADPIVVNPDTTTLAVRFRADPDIRPLSRLDELDGVGEEIREDLRQKRGMAQDGRIGFFEHYPGLADVKQGKGLGNRDGGV